MEQLLILVVLALLVLPVWVIIRIVSLGRQNNAIAEKLIELEREVVLLRHNLQQRHAGPVQQVAPAAAPVSVAPAAPPAPAAPSVQPPSITPAPAPVPVAATPPTQVQPPRTVPVPAAPTTNPPTLPVQPVRAMVPPPVPPRRTIDWERFTGAMLFAWFGGIAAFLGAAFFIKYSFEHDLIPPEVRVAIGFVFALGLIIGGLKVPRPRYTVIAQTLIATGIVSLYAVTFACNSIYHFAFFGPLATFILMCLITATGFLLAVRLDARVIALLGMLGGFATPVLLSTGHDNPPGLFGYIALLDAGLIAVALNRRWFFVVPLGALGTIAMQIGWATRFLSPAKSGVAMVVTLGFSVLFLVAYGVARRLGRNSRHVTGSAIALPVVALGFAGALLDYSSVSAHPGWWFAFVVLVDACLLAITWFDEENDKLHLIAGMLVFALLAGWTAIALSDSLLPWALAFYLVFAALHTAFPLVLARHRPTAAPTWWSQLFPPLTLLLMMLPLFKIHDVSIVLWPCVLLVDALAIVVAMFTGSLVAVAAVLVLTLGATGVWLLRMPATLDAAPALLLVVGGFASLFFAATVFLSRRLAGGGLNAATPVKPMADPRVQLPAFSALLPFALLIMMTQQLPFTNPSPVFGLGLLLVVLTLGLAWIMSLEWLPACALGGIAALEYAWHVRHFTTTAATTPLLWYVVFAAVFAAFPFVFRRRFASLTGPWAVAAIACAVQFPLVYFVVRDTWPNDFMGLLPAAFAVPPLVSLVAILRLPVTSERARLNQLAWFGGTALLFITLVFPIQFSRQWLTLAWSLEGAALLWLFHRVPHPGLKAIGVVLLVVAFVRLAVNPAVLEYHARSSVPLLNWYLYSYGTVIAALFVGARLIAPPRNSVLGINSPPLLATLGTILAFLLLNIEIADYFSTPGAHVLTFRFSGNFARDMSYTIGWAVFALALLLMSIWRQLRPGRIGALALLGVALLKLFLHDLARLDALYRVGALFAVAIVAIAASFAYQRFLPRDDEPATRDE